MRSGIAWAVAALLVPGIAGCGSGDGGEPRAVATTGILADLAQHVAGADVEVEQLIPDGSTPHDFSLSADDRLLLEDADLVIANGAGLEASISLDDVATPRWELTDHVGPLLPGDDPHVWMDPSRVARALPGLAHALADQDPAHAADFRARARAYQRELRSLDRDLRRTLAAVPRPNRELVTSHDALAYFADRYGFEIVATAFPSSGPEAEASAAAIDDVIDAVRASGVPAVFAGEEDDPEVLELVAEETGVSVVDDLIVESLGSAPGYGEMIRHDAVEIAAALAPR